MAYGEVIEIEPETSHMHSLLRCRNVVPIYDVIFSPGMVSSTLKSDIVNHITSVSGVVSRYPTLRFLDELITKVS